MKLSEYIGEETSKTAIVYRDKKKYVVSAKDKFGNHFSSYHESEETAEQYAEDWVMKK